MAFENPDREIVSLLLSIGLSEREARVYSNLLSKGEKQAVEIAKLTGIPQPHVYSILKTLQSKEIVEVLPEKTKKYRAVPLDQAIDRLIGEKEKALISLKSKSHEIAQKIKVDEQGMYLVDFKPIFGRNEIDKKIMEMLQTAKKVVLGITSASKLFKYEEYIPIVKQFRARKIDFIVLINEPEKIDKINLFNDAGGEIKILNQTNIPRKLIVDESVLLVDASFDQPDEQLSYGIWTNHKDIVKKEKEKFQELRNKSKDLKAIIHV